MVIVEILAFQPVQPAVARVGVEKIRLRDAEILRVAALNQDENFFVQLLTAILGDKGI